MNRVLVACEESQVVTKAFRAVGVEAYSCDLKPCTGGHPEWHIENDVKKVLQEQWDCVIAHPPCRNLSVSGARYWKEKRETGEQQKSVLFFTRFTQLQHIPHVCIENPVSIMSTLYRKPDQTIQPWEFGHPESKRTCLWLKCLPPLLPTKVLSLPDCGHWHNQTPSGQNKLPPSSERAALRARTYEGIATAMATQWGSL